MKSKGFTLLEIMIVVAIISILAAIVYPSYQRQVMETKRSDAVIALTQAAAMQERLLTSTGSYSTAEGTLLPSGSKTENAAYNFYSILPADDENDRKVSFTTANGTTSTKTFTCSGKRCFILAVSPIGPQARDAECAILTLDSVGRQMSYNNSGSLNSAGTCWK